jgi:hypothetical protein
MADVTRCRHAEIDGEAELPTASLVAWQARGWEPISESRSPEAAEDERIDAENAAAVAPPKPRATPVTRPTGTTAGDAGKNKEK